MVELQLIALTVVAVLMTVVGITLAKGINVAIKNSLIVLTHIKIRIIGVGFKLTLTSNHADGYVNDLIIKKMLNFSASFFILCYY